MRNHFKAAAGLLIFLIAFPTLQVLRSTQQSATWDEPMHLTAGYAALAAGDFRVDPSHPPLARAWAAIPLAVSGAPLDTSVIDRTSVPDWLSAGYAFARDFVSRPGIDRTLVSARAMAIVWGVLLGLLVFAWVFEWLGTGPALLALALYTAEPNLAAHSALVTTDAPLTVFVFGAVYFLWRFSSRPDTWNLAGVAVCTALALVTKFSAVLLVPILGALLAWMVARGRLRVRDAALVCGACAGLSLVVIWAAYGFRYLPSDDPGWLLTRETLGASADGGWLASLLTWLDGRRLLPNAFAEGLVFSLGSARGLPAFLAGEVRADGWWYYFPVAILLKTPVMIVILAVAGAVLLMRRRQSGITAAFVLVPIAIWLIGAAVSGVNLGVRHVLPVYPFLVLLTVVTGVELLRHRRAAFVLTAMFAVIAVEVARSEPYPLSFFNVAAGGPANGFRYLADSNLGWGGSLKALREWMDESAVDHVNLAYFGSVDPAAYGVRATYLPSSATFLADRFARPILPGYVAISGTALGGVYLPPWWRRFYSGFQDREPVAVIGNTMRVYWVQAWPEPSVQPVNAESLRTLAEGLLFGLRWPEQAIRRYDEYVQWNPGDPAGWNGRSLALAQTGRTAEALDGFRRVLALSPADPDVRRNIALLEQQLPGGWARRE